MYKCNVCGHTQEEAGEHCGQPMVMAEAGQASDQPTAPTAPAAPATPSEPSSEGSGEEKAAA